MYFGNCSALGCQMKRLLIVIWIPIETGPFVSDCGPVTVLPRDRLPGLLQGSLGQETGHCPSPGATDCPEGVLY